MSKWFYATNGKQRGPISDEELQNLITSGVISQSVLVWAEGMAEWTPAGTLEGVSWPASISPPTPPPSTQFPSPHFSQPAAGGYPPTQVPLTNYLPWAIAATLLCCLPTGIAAIIYSSNANNAKSRGDILAAQKANENAKLWLILSVVLGIAAVIFFLAID